jgi:hypothetical protein
VDDFKASHEVIQATNDSSKPNHSKETQESSAWEPYPWHSINPENPWNSNVMNIPLKNVSPHAVKNPGQRVNRKTSHKK